MPCMYFPKSSLIPEASMRTSERVHLQGYLSNMDQKHVGWVQLILAVGTWVKEICMAFRQWDGKSSHIWFSGVLHLIKVTDRTSTKIVLYKSIRIRIHSVLSPLDHVKKRTIMLDASFISSFFVLLNWLGTLNLGYIKWRPPGGC